MPNSRPKPILNASLPAQFRKIRIELAREPDHPEGDAGVAYVIVAPLDANDKIDPALWRAHREAAGSRDQGQTKMMSTVISFIVKAAAGFYITRYKQTGCDRFSLRGRTFRIGRIRLDQ